MARPDHDPDDSISAATRALADATAALTRLVGKQVQSVVPEVSEALASSLREASRGLAEASDTVGRRAGAGRAEERRREKVDRTRADLLDAAARVIAAQGYEGASVGDIAAEAGYTKGALYAHFGSKREVMLALARERLGIALADPEIAVPGVTDDGVDVAELTDWLTHAHDDPRLLLSLEFLTYGLRNPDAGDELAELHRTTFDTIAAQVARIRAGQGRPRPGGTPVQDDRDDALVLISVINIATLEGMLTGSPDTSPEAAARVLARLLAP